MPSIAKPAITTMLAAGASLLVLANSSLAAPVQPKVVIITMFGEEAKPWLEGETFTRKIKVPGLNADYPDVACTDAGLCMMTTAMGFANAASAVAAVALSPQFDLQHSYFIIAGIAGVDPKHGTLGSAHWAKYAVDVNLNHRIDQREIPAEWTSNFFGLGSAKPGEKPKWGAGTEIFALNDKLADFALAVSKNVELQDGDTAKAYRQHYAEDAARSAPFVSICDTASADTYWHGSKMGDAVADWVKLLSDGKAIYCTSQMEDNASLTALKRASEAGRLDFERVALLRTASNFDRQGKDQTAADSLAAKSGGFPLATSNAYRVAKALANPILENWSAWQDKPSYQMK